jgi:HPt (histidine-containing phosphotransfer) domain-containing protein
MRSPSGRQSDRTDAPAVSSHAQRCDRSAAITQSDRTESPGAQDEPLGSFRGIDVSTWRDSGLGDARLYWRLLEMFLQQHQDYPAPFDAALASGDMTTLRRQAHNMKSTAATLGAHGVERAAAALESACVAGAQAARLQPLLHEMGEQLLPVLEGLRRWRAARSGP